MVYDPPWFLNPSNLFLILSFFYISGFLITSLFFHGIMSKSKIDKGKPKDFTKLENICWFLFSVFWFLFSFAALFYLIKTSLNTTKKEV